MMPPKDDSEWIDQIATGNPQAREAAILRYVPLVHFVLNRIGVARGNGIDYDDLTSQGLLGLIEAVDGYDPDRGTQFSTYATFRIRGRVLDYLRAQDWTPRSVRRRARQIQQATDELWSALQRSPEEAELADHLGMEISEVQQSLKDVNRMIVSFDSFTGLNQEDDLSLLEVLPDGSQPDPEEQYDEAELKERVMKALTRLGERERLILSLYYYDELTLKEIGELLGVSESRVCQLHARAVLNLRAILKQDDRLTVEASTEGVWSR